MFGNHFDHIRQMFADQFEPEGQGYIYRKHMKGRPIQVSIAERDKYISAFNRFLKYSHWGIAGGTVFLSVLLVIYAVVAGVDLPEMAVYVGLGAILATFMAAYFWTWNLPTRELRERASTGETRSREEIKRLFLKRLTYGQIAAAAGAGVFLILKARAGGNMLSGWNILWTFLAIALLILSAVQAFRKWRFESLQG